ncbi:MAG: hypothetical protein EBT18_05165 [Gammaproteobacteria bacterium]|nr:hypothetical protein [Gammaproteobacteria bacterium]
MKSTVSILIGLLWLSTGAVADGPPEGGDAKAWCEANENACFTWCETHQDHEICKEPECD